MTTARAPFILDVDTGIDDAVALALAVASPEVELLAVSTVAGNIDVARSTENRIIAEISRGGIVAVAAHDCVVSEVSPAIVVAG